MKRWLGLSLGLLVLGCAGAKPKPAMWKQPAAPAVPALETGLVFGTDDPYTLLGFDPQAQWLALCQARQDTNGDGITRVGFFHHGERAGDQMQTYFVLGGGEGEAVDAFLGSSASGNWVALRRGAQIYLLDTRTRKKRELASLRLDREPDPSAAGGIRTLSFAPEQERLLLVEEARGQAGVAVMELGTGAVHRFDLGPGRVWQAGFSNDGSWLFASVVTRDRDGNGKLDLPTIATNLGGDACGQASSYSTFGLKEPHDELTQVAVPIAGGKWRAVESAQGTLAGDLVWTRPDGALVRESAAGKQQVLSGPSCRGAVLDYYSLESDRWLVACVKAPAAPSAALPDHGAALPPPREQATEVWVFGKDLPPQGKPTGISLEYGADPGHFGTRRYSSLRAESGVFYYDLHELRAIPVPAGFETCAGKDGHYLLQAEAGGVYEWSPGAAPKLVTTEKECDRLDDRYTLLGTSVFDWTERKLVGSVVPLCQGRECRKLTYGPFSPTQHFLRARPRATTVDAAALEARLRESLAALGAKKYAEHGPLSFESWSPLASAAPSPAPPVQEPEARFSFMQPPPASCQPLVSEAVGKPSELPSWTVVRPVGGAVASFPPSTGARDDLPTFEQLAQQLCEARDFSFVLDDVERVAERAAAQASPAASDSPLQRIDLERTPAFDSLEMLASRCAPADTCRLGVAIADSRYQRTKAAIAPKLLMACDATTAGERLSELRAQPLLELEWLVAGKGRKPGSVARIQALLDQILASKDRYDMESAIALVAADDRPEAAAVLLATRARLAKAPAPLTALVPTKPGDPPESPFGVEDLDVSLHTTRSPRLLKLYRETCRRLTTGKDVASFKSYRCGPAKPGEKPARVQYRFLDRFLSRKPSELSSLPRVLGPEQEQQCAKAFAGKCPALPVAKLPGHDTWHSLYLAAVELTRPPSSPLAGGLFDTPLRRSQRKLTATWRLWLGGELYEAGPAALTAVSLPWAEKQTALPDGEALAIRGFLAWLNGVARARGSTQRFFYARHGIDNYLLMATEQQACALNGATSFHLSQDPVTRDPFR